MGIVNFASSQKDRISFDYSHGKTAVTVLGNIKSPLYDIVYKHIKGHAVTCKLIVMNLMWKLEIGTGQVNLIRSQQTSVKLGLCLKGFLM